jgi:plasmid maintenance system antidote protein VapI
VEHPRLPRIASAVYRGGQLVTRFEDGSCVSTPIEGLLRPGTQDGNWSRLTFNPFEIVVPTADGAVEIPWNVIRVLTDKEYDAYIAAAAKERPRAIGARLRDLRERRPLSSQEVADIAGLDADRLSQIESGTAAISGPTLDRILEAMGSSLQEFAAMGSAVASRHPQPPSLGVGDSGRRDTARPAGDLRPVPRSSR